MANANHVEVVVKQYVCSGPPYFGHIPRYGKGSNRDGTGDSRAVYDERKELAKAAGVAWKRNPDYKEDMGRHSGVDMRPFMAPTERVDMGWHVAPTEHALCQLVCSPLFCEWPIWVPNDIGMQNMAVAEVVLKRRKAEAEEKDAAMRKSREPSEAETEQNKRRVLGIPDCTESEKAELLAHGIVHSKELMEATHTYELKESSAVRSLGPRSNISDAARLLRGLQLGLVSKKDVQDGLQKYRGEEHVETRKRQRVDAPLEGSTTLCTISGRTCVPRQEIADDHDAMPESYPCTLLPIERPPEECLRCGAKVWKQFMECSCDRGRAEWVNGVELALGTTNASGSETSVAAILRPTFVRKFA